MPQMQFIRLQRTRGPICNLRKLSPKAAAAGAALRRARGAKRQDDAAERAQGVAAKGFRIVLDSPTRSSDDRRRRCALAYL